MPALIRNYVNFVDTWNRRIGRVVMYGIFAMIAVLLYSSISKTFFYPSLWTLELAQFLMVGYYMVGGAYALQQGAHVRMDLFYGSFSPVRKAWFDVFTIILLIVYLAVLLYGGISSTTYALEYGERSYSAWRPYMAPIKIIMCFGILMMLLQAISTFFKDVATIRGESL